MGDVLSAHEKKYVFLNMFLNKFGAHIRYISFGYCEAFLTDKRALRDEYRGRDDAPCAPLSKLMVAEYCDDNQIAYVVYLKFSSAVDFSQSSLFIYLYLHADFGTEDVENARFAANPTTTPWIGPAKWVVTN